MMRTTELYRRAPMLGALLTMGLLTAWGLPGLAVFHGLALTLASAEPAWRVAALPSAAALLTELLAWATGLLGLPA